MEIVLTSWMNATRGRWVHKYFLPSLDVGKLLFKAIHRNRKLIKRWMIVENCWAASALWEFMNSKARDQVHSNYAVLRSFYDARDACKVTFVFIYKPPFGANVNYHLIRLRCKFSRKIAFLCFPRVSLFSVLLEHGINNKQRRIFSRSFS